jgi:predicted MFS family arabinose efflux permease
LTSIGVLTGSTISGYISLQLSYATTFLAAGVLLMIGVSFLSQFHSGS